MSVMHPVFSKSLHQTTKYNIGHISGGDVSLERRIFGNCHVLLIIGVLVEVLRTLGRAHRQNY